MKIIIVIGSFLPVPTLYGGAVEKMWYALAKEFAIDGHEVLMISKRNIQLPVENNEYNISHIRVKGYETPKSRIVLKFMDLMYSRRALKKIPLDADIIITNTFWIPLIASKSTKAKMIVDVARMPKGQMKFYKGVASLRANSSAVELAIKKELGNNSNIPLFTIPNPLPFIPVSDVNFQTKENSILYVGRLDPEKGLHLLIEAFVKINIGKLKIIGPWQTEYGGGGEKYLKALKKISDQNENIEFTGPIFDDKILQQEYEKASIFVYPSLAEQGETFGIAPLEAMAWGCVPIVSSLQCFHDFIKDGYNGLFFDHKSNHAVALLAEKMLSILQDHKARIKLAMNALKVRDTHATSTISKQFQKVFVEIVKHKI